MKCLTAVPPLSPPLCSKVASQIGVTMESQNPSNLPGPDSDCTPSEKTNLGAQSERICGTVFSTLGETAV